MQKLLAKPCGLAFFDIRGTNLATGGILLLKNGIKRRR